jgi:hypothetical protein
VGPIHVEQAMNFVRHKGNPVTMAFAGYAVGRIGEKELLDNIVAYQHDDGGAGPQSVTIFLSHPLKGMNFAPAKPTPT